MKNTAAYEKRTSVLQKSSVISALSGLLAFLFGSASLFGSVSPFGIAIVAGVPLRYSFTAAIGGIIGSLLFLGTKRGFYFAAVIFAIFAMRLILFKTFKKRPKAVGRSILTFIVTGICAFFYGAFLHVDLISGMLLAIEAALAGCCTFFFATADDVLLQMDTPASFTYPQRASLLILLISIICSLAGFEFFNINFGVIFGVCCIYIAIEKRGILGASVVSISTAIALNLYSTQMLKFTGILIIAGFLSGIFSPLKKVGHILSFLTVSLFFLFLTGAPDALTSRIADLFLASAVYVLIPEKWTNKIGSWDQSVLPDQPQSPQKNISAQLTFASDTIRDLQDELSQVAGKFRGIDYNSIGSICDSTAEKVCRGCTKMLVCWDDDSSETLDAFNGISDRLRINGEITPDSVPIYLKNQCCKLEKLCASVNEYYRCFISRQNEKRQAAESRRIVFEQFNSMADMLVEVSGEFSGITGYDSKMTKEVAKVYNRLEMAPEQIVCPVDRYGRSRIEIYTSNALKTSPKVLCEALSDASGYDFDLPSIQKVQGKTRISLFEKACFYADFSAQQSCYQDNTVCGDDYEYFQDAEGYLHILLSDGMGKGKRAAIDSVMTCSVLVKLLKAGFGFPAALKLLNSSLLVKSDDESLATIDMMKIDLYTGKAELYKAGAAATFLYSNGEIQRFSSKTPPLGILEDADCEKQTFSLANGDIVIMTSDGATASGEGWIGDALRKLSRSSAKEIAVNLCCEAKERSADSHPDDITVIAVKLQKS